MSVDLLFQLGWKSSLIAVAALAGASMLRNRPPAERVAVLRVGALLILALPLLVALMPALRIETPDWVAFGTPTAHSEADPVPAASSPASGVGAASVPFPSAPAVQAPEGALRVDPGIALLFLWGLGFSALTMRLVTGILLLNRWTRRAAPVSDPRWNAALARAAHGRSSPELRVSSRVYSPLSWGYRPGVILLDGRSLAKTEQADAVLAHEMAHVRHGDWVFLILSRLLVAVLWFNPLVWLLQRELARQSEQAADAWAATRVGRTDYASALVAMATYQRPHAALGIAASRSELGRRVTAILSLSPRRGKPWRAGVAIVGCLAIVTPLAAVDVGASAKDLERVPLARSAAPSAPPASRLGAGLPKTATPIAAASSPLADIVVRDASNRLVSRRASSERSDIVSMFEAAFEGEDHVDENPGPRDDTGPNQTLSARVLDAPQTVQQKRMTAAGLRQGAQQIETQIKIMQRAVASSGDPDQRERMFADSQEMTAEAEALRREADEIDASG